MLFVGCKIKTGPAQTGCKTTPRQGAARVWTHGINKQRAGPASRPTRTRPTATEPRNATPPSGNARPDGVEARPRTRRTAPATKARPPRGPHRACAPPTGGQRVHGRRRPHGPQRRGGHNVGSGGHPPYARRHTKPRPHTAHGRGGDGAGCRQGASTAGRAKERRGAQAAPDGGCSSFRSGGKDSERREPGQGKAPLSYWIKPRRSLPCRESPARGASPPQCPKSRRCPRPRGRSVEKSAGGLAFLHDFSFLCSRRGKAPRSET